TQYSSAPRLRVPRGRGLRSNEQQSVHAGGAPSPGRGGEGSLRQVDDEELDGRARRGLGGGEKVGAPRGHRRPGETRGVSGGARFMAVAGQEEARRALGEASRGQPVDGFG